MLKRRVQDSTEGVQLTRLLVKNSGCRSQNSPIIVVENLLRLFLSFFFNNGLFGCSLEKEHFFCATFNLEGEQKYSKNKTEVCLIFRKSYKRIIRQSKILLRCPV